MNRRYDVLLCDADNTIFDFDQAEVNAFADACVFAGVENTPEHFEMYSRINKALWKLLEQGGITQSVLRVRRFEQFVEAMGRSDIDAQAMALAFVESLGRQSVPIEGAVEAVRRWSGVLPVIIVTNGIARVQHGRMEGSAVQPYISGLVISEEAGRAKPDPEMLYIGMKMAGVTDASRALMLGDSLSSDIAAAANAGVDACWYNPGGLANTKGLPVAYEIRCLDEVDAILRGGQGKGEL
ncbi:MAG: YjjG family noncanonical pyrimidine nucleotidase [Clostridia bacterium]|nr:YjjG family noncanonical pyrimidine nucleotidase [Clostridia bacterium]